VEKSANHNYIRYGKQTGIENTWRDIISISDNKQRHQKIDELIKLMENNKDENGFFGQQDEIVANVMFSAAMKIDDRELYYSLFDTLAKKMNENENLEEPQSDGTVAYYSVGETMTNYFYDRNNKSRGSRKGILANGYFEKIGNEDVWITPSVKDFKGQNCAECVEMASVAHNLWLLLGRKSHYCKSMNVNFPSVSNNDGHAFTIIEALENRFLLFDMSMQNVCMLDGNPIEKMLNGEPVIVSAANGAKNPGCYANFEKTKESNITPK